MFIDSICKYPFTKAVVSAEGNISFCDAMHNSSHHLGNILENSFDEIWYSPIADEIRRNVIDQKIHDQCQCQECPVKRQLQPYPLNNIDYNEHPLTLTLELDVKKSQHHSDISAFSIIPCLDSFYEPDFESGLEIASKASSITQNIWEFYIIGNAELFYKNKRNKIFLFEILRNLLFEDNKERIHLQLTTNGMLFDKDIRQKYIESVCKSTTIFSMNSSSVGIYQKIWGYDYFEKVINNIFSFNRERNKQQQKLELLFNINEINISEATEMVHLSKSLEADLVIFGSNRKDVNPSSAWMFLNVQNKIIEECKKNSLLCKFNNSLDYGYAIF